MLPVQYANTINIGVLDGQFLILLLKLLSVSFCACFINVCAKLGQHSGPWFLTGTTKRRVTTLKSPGRLQGPLILLLKWVTEAFCLAAKYPGCKFNHSDPTSAELTRGQGYNCTTLLYLHDTLICPDTPCTFAHWCTQFLSAAQCTLFIIYKLTEWTTFQHLHIYSNILIHFPSFVECLRSSDQNYRTQ